MRSVYARRRSQSSTLTMCSVSIFRMRYGKLSWPYHIHSCLRVSTILGMSLHQRADVHDQNPQR